MRCYEGHKLLIIVWGLLFFRFAESSVVSLPLGLLEIPAIRLHVPKAGALKASETPRILLLNFLWFSFLGDFP